MYDVVVLETDRLWWVPSCAPSAVYTAYACHMCLSKMQQ